MLFALSLGNFALMYLANVYLARHLHIDEFDDYSVAISVVTLLSSMATLGLEKYALRGMALSIERENWPRLRGYLSFSVRTIILFSILLMGVMSLSLESILTWHEADFHPSIVIYCGFLPIIALCLFQVEVITVYGQQILALAMYRFFLPALYLLLLMTFFDARFELNAISAVLCLGSAWCITLLLIWITARVTSPREMRQSTTLVYRKRVWLKRSLPLLLSSLMMTVLTSAGTIILEILYPSETVVGIFAVAMQTTALISLIGTSTNRYYLPMLVVLLERKDNSAIKALLIKRLWLIAGFISIFLGITFKWGHEILSVFGTEFTQGYMTLCISACGASFSTLFSEAPYYLQFMGRNRLVVGSISLAAISMVSLSFLLGQQFGATGVAIAYAIPTALLFCSLKWLSRQHMRQYLAQCSK